MRIDVAARSYLGIPFAHQGRDPRFGIDCVGLLVLSAMDCGLHGLLSHDFTSYPRNPAHGELERRLGSALGQKVSEIMPGCVVSLQFVGHDRSVSRHVAIVGEIGNRLTLIHTYNKPNRVIEHGIDHKWQRRITGIYSTESA